MRFVISELCSFFFYVAPLETAVAVDAGPVSPLCEVGPSSLLAARRANVAATMSGKTTVASA